MNKLIEKSCLTLLILLPEIQPGKNILKLILTSSSRDNISRRWVDRSGKKIKYWLMYIHLHIIYWLTWREKKIVNGRKIGCLVKASSRWIYSSHTRKSGCVHKNYSWLFYTYTLPCAVYSRGADESEKNSINFTPLSLQEEQQSVFLAQEVVHKQL